MSPGDRRRSPPSLARDHRNGTIRITDWVSNRRARGDPYGGHKTDTSETTRATYPRARMGQISRHNGATIDRACTRVTPRQSQGGVDGSSSSEALTKPLFRLQSLTLSAKFRMLKSDESVPIAPPPRLRDVSTPFRITSTDLSTARRRRLERDLASRVGKLAQVDPPAELGVVNLPRGVRISVGGLNLLPAQAAEAEQVVRRATAELLAEHAELAAAQTCICAITTGMPGHKYGASSFDRPISTPIPGGTYALYLKRVGWGRGDALRMQVSDGLAPNQTGVKLSIDGGPYVSDWAKEIRIFSMCRGSIGVVRQTTKGWYGVCAQDHYEDWLLWRRHSHFSQTSVPRNLD